MRALEHKLRELVNGFPIGWALVAAMAIALALCFALIVALLRRQHERKWLVALMMALGSVFIVAGAALCVAQGMIMGFVNAPSTEIVDQSQLGRLVATAVSDVLLIVYFAGNAAMIVLPIVAFASWYTRPFALWQRLTVVAVPLLLVAVWAALGWAKHASASWGGCVDPQEKARFAWETLVEAREAVGWAKAALWSLGGISALGLGLLALRDARRGMVAARRSVVASSALLLLGLIAAAASRASGYDAAHLLVPLGEECPVGQVSISELPSGPTRLPRGDLPTVEVWREHYTLDGFTLSSPEEFQKILVSKRELWRALNPKQGGKLHTVRFVAERQERVAGMQRWISAAQRAGFDEMALLHRATPEVLVHTRTLGAVTRRRCGEAYLSLDADVPLELRFENWEQISAAAVGGLPH
jgi:hypothetical protein